MCAQSSGPASGPEAAGSQSSSPNEMRNAQAWGSGESEEGEQTRRKEEEKIVHSPGPTVDAGKRCPTPVRRPG